jgi:WhiB family redox-sensing transcriptional regulator
VTKAASASRCSPTRPSRSHELHAPADLFFPERDGNANDDVREARAVCSTCPVRVECLDHALDNDERLGVWGGTSRLERRHLRLRRRAEAS